MRLLLPIIIIVPALEIWLLILSGKYIGVPLTIFLIILTGVIGASLAKREGIVTINRAREQMARGQVPGVAILDGLCVIIGGILLLTPGFITDITGFLLLFPPTRLFAKKILIGWLRRRIDRGEFTINFRR